MENEKAVIAADTAVHLQNREQTGAEIDLMELLFKLLEKIGYIILVTVICAVAAGLITQFLITPIYESTAKLYVVESSDSVVNLSDLQIGTYLAADYQEVFKTWEVNEQVLNNLQLSYTYTELTAMLTISNPTNTRILYVTVHSPDAREAALIANEYANVAREYIANVMATDKPSMLSNALESVKPVSPSLVQNIVLGALLGLLLSVGIITVLFVMDDKVKSPDDLMRYAGMSTLAIVPRTKNIAPAKAIKVAKKRKDKKQTGVELP